MKRCCKGVIVCIHHPSNCTYCEKHWKRFCDKEEDFLDRECLVHYLED